MFPTMRIRNLFPPVTPKPTCGFCHGNGWVDSASLEGYEPPEDAVFVQRCGECERYANDIKAAEAREAQGHGEYIGVLCGTR